MAFQTGTPSDWQNLVSTIETFLTSESPGWIVDRATAAASPFDLSVRDGQGGFFQMSQITTSRLALNASTGFDGSGIGAEPGSAYNSLNNSTLVDTDGNGGPWQAYYMYANMDPANGPMYLHVVLEFESQRYRHFGFGTLDKFGSYTGGQYVYGTFWSQTGANAYSVDSFVHYLPFDANQGGGGVSVNHMAVRIDINDAIGYTGTIESPSQNWATPFANAVDGNGASHLQMQGDVRGELYWPFTQAAAESAFNGFLPQMPCPLFLKNETANPDEIFLLGYARDIRWVNMDNVQPGQSITVGGDTWDFYPAATKSLTEVSGVESSKNLGYAYRRIP